MKTKFNQQEILVLMAVIIAILLHVVWVVRQSSVAPQTSRNKGDGVAQAIQFKVVTNTQSSSEKFSLLFGVIPEKIEIASEEKPHKLTLFDMIPKLLAIDEVNGSLTARLSVSSKEPGQNGSIQKTLEQKMAGSRFLSAMVGDVIHDFTLTELTNNNALFLHNPQADEQALPPISLDLFKPQAMQ